MKKNTLVRLSNIVKADKEMNDLLNRPKTEVVGMSLFYGEPFLGKTQYVTHKIFSNGWLYLRIQDRMTPRTFLQTVYRRLNKTINDNEAVPPASSSKLEDMCITMLGDHPEIVFAFDEINLVIQERQWGILEIIRGFADMSFATFPLVGEHDTYDKIAAYNPHFYNRCGFFYKFQPCTIGDYKKLCDEILEGIAFKDDLIKHIHETTKGYVGKAVSLIDDYEKLAKKENKKIIGLQDI